MTINPLEEHARRYAKRAVLADRRGDYEEALKNYKRAVELFNKIISLYPDAPFTPLYRVLAEKYSKRIEVLEKQLSALPQGGRDTVPGDTHDFSILYPGERVNITFKDVVGLDHVKNLLKKIVIYPLRKPELYPLGWPRGILLFGPPGCGKTYITLALANEANAVLISVTMADIMSKWLGVAEKNVKRLFNTARDIALKGIPVIVFVDEVDGLLRSYSSEVGGEVRARNQFLIEMDGLISKSDEELPLFVIGATNKPWLLDPGFIRRFQKRVYIPPPDKATRKKLFEYYISKLMRVYKLDPSVDTEKLAELTEGYSSFDIKQIVTEVQNNVAGEILEKAGTGETLAPRPITMSDFVKVIQLVKPSIDRKQLAMIMEWSKAYMSI
ncbi:AAA family ATPase [Desulfurococcaceae archaeon MEX13E-LK6-19]|nr:AAA family ATPase [Desulfurococcaceae archaeon MEX13E-LK6-19]